MDAMPTNSEISEIAALAANQLFWQAKVTEAELLLKDAADRLRQVQEIDLPNAMAQAGVSSITLPSGEKVSIKEDIFASIPKNELYHEALDWLREHGFGDVIKNAVTVSFGKGEDEQADELLRILAEHHWRQMADQKMSVHPQTLKALIKEQLAKGTNVPFELFGVVPFTKAIIK